MNSTNYSKYSFEVIKNIFLLHEVFSHIFLWFRPMSWGLNKKYTFIYERQNLKSVEGRRILNTTTYHKNAISTHISLIRWIPNKSRGYLWSNKHQTKYQSLLRNRFNVFFIIFLWHYWNLFTFCLPWKLLRRKSTTNFLPLTWFTFLHYFSTGSSLTGGCINLVLYRGEDPGIIGK